ncbi:MAG: rhomboid family intramembrane serine protease [Sandaracinobacteroides sp.]
MAILTSSNQKQIACASRYKMSLFCNAVARERHHLWSALLQAARERWSMRIMRNNWVGWAWGCSLVLVWALVALQLDQPLLQAQLPKDLVDFGAFKGREVLAAEPWRLVTAQWLHKDISRMLFTALMIAILSSAVAERTSVAAMLVIGIGGGVVGLFAGVLAYPEVIRFGASQAHQALCGAVIILFIRTQPIWWIALLGMFASVAFDLFQSSQGAVQFGFLFGFGVGFLLFVTGRTNTLGKRGKASHS